jgi:8-oxo-dGTP pyrophosphatase MutT (NUDIX family)
MSEKVCDHTSVGMIVYRPDGKLLVIERMKPPYGFAAPAGHVDSDTTYEAAAVRELQEEVGLVVVSMELVLEADMQNPCRRQGGNWHHWKVYNVTTTGEIRRSQEEVKQTCWVTGEVLGGLAVRSRQYQEGKIAEDDWRQNPGLEPVWLQLFERLGIIQR